MQKPTVLIVDDCQMMRQFLATFLSKKYVVTQCATAEEALRLAESGFRPQVVVTDLDLPQMSGTELTRSLRLSMPFTPVLALSGIKESRHRLAVLAAGADDFMAKPFHPAELDVRIIKLLDRREKMTASPKMAAPIPLNWFGQLRRVAAVFSF